MKVWWSRSPANGNFGDILTPLILNHYNIPCEYATLKTAQAISTGSIIRYARPNMMVLGSGVIDSQDKICTSANYRFVRGKITRNIVLSQGGQCPDIYGDPAILLPRIFKRNIEPINQIGIFAHYVDLINYPQAINPLQPVHKVLKDIWLCKKIISSSLHGIIAAHSYGIPAAWVKLGGKLTGDDVKFHDYAQSVGIESMPISTIEKPIYILPKINDNNIHEVFLSL